MAKHMLMIRVTVNPTEGPQIRLCSWVYRPGLGLSSTGTEKCGGQWIFFLKSGSTCPCFSYLYNFLVWMSVILIHLQFLLNFLTRSWKMLFTYLLTHPFEYLLLSSCFVFKALRSVSCIIWFSVLLNHTGTPKVSGKFSAHLFCKIHTAPNLTACNLWTKKSCWDLHLPFFVKTAQSWWLLSFYLSLLLLTIIHFSRKGNGIVDRLMEFVEVMHVNRGSCRLFLIRAWVMLRWPEVCVHIHE